MTQSHSLAITQFGTCLQVHVTTCFLFYARAARETGSSWGVRDSEPFTFGFVLYLLYLLVDWILLRCRWQRDVHMEASGATHKTYQEARDADVATYGHFGSKVGRYIMPASGHSKRPAASPGRSPDSRHSPPPHTQRPRAHTQSEHGSSSRSGGSRDGGRRDGGSRDGGSRDGGRRDGGSRDGGRRDGGSRGVVLL